MKAEIRFDSSVSGPKIHPYLFGHFLENMAAGIYRGGLLSKGGEVRSTVEKAMDELSVSLLRWPGGLFADGYHFQDGIGQNRPVRKNRYWKRFGPLFGPKDPNCFGTDEFLALCERIGTTPYINVNLGTGTIKEAANWVQYCNGDSNTQLGKRRAENGREAPWNVPIWGIGNETYGWWALGHTTPQTYGKQYLEFLDAMAAEDSNIKPVAVGADENWPIWNKKLLETIGDRAAYLALHLYLPGDNKPQNMIMRAPGNSQTHYKLSSSYLELSRRIQVMAEDIRTVLGDNHDMAIALDEWNLWWWWPQVLRVWWKMRDAVAAASMAGVMVEHCDIVKMGNLAQIINVLGLIQSNYGQVVKTPMYYVMQMFAQTLKGNRIDCTVDVPTYASQQFGGIPKSDNTPYVSSYAAVDGDKVGVIIVQRCYESPVTVKMETPGVKFQTMTLLAGQSPEDKNTFREPERIRPVESEIKDGKGGVEVTLPPVCVVALSGVIEK